MMSVLEYANDMGKSSDDILKMCEKLNIKVSNLDDMLSDDDIVELDNAFENEDEYSQSDEDEIIKKIEEDDYYDEVVDTLIDKKDTIYSNEPSPTKKKKAKKKDIKEQKKAMYKNKEKLVSNENK